MLPHEMTGDITSAHAAGHSCPWRRTVGVASWGARFGVAGILAQTLFFKFTYAPETQYIFADRGGRPAATFVGVVELICVALLLFPRMAVWGAGLAMVTITGALLTHLTSLGVVVVNPATGEGDGGLLFGLAVIVFLGSLAILVIHRRQLPWLRGA